MSANSPLRVGVVGLGWAGEQHLAGYARTAGDAKVLTIAGLDVVQRSRLAEQYSIPHTDASFEALVARDDLDAVSLCVPNHLHAPAALAALASGKHVLCEKPLARNGEEAAAMMQAARKHDRVLHVAFNYRRRGDVDVLRQHVQAGLLGRIYHARLWWLRRRGIPTIASWFTGAETAGGGAFIDLGVHLLDLAVYLMDDPEVVTVSAATHAELGTRGRGGDNRGTSMLGNGAFEVEDLACGFLRLRDGATVSFEVAWAVHGRANNEFGLTLYGTEGGAEITVVGDGSNKTLRIYTDVGGVPAEIRPETGPGNGHIGVVRDFVDAATGRADKHDRHYGAEGVKINRIIDAAYASAKRGTEVALVHTGT